MSSIPPILFIQGYGTSKDTGPDGEMYKCEARSRSTIHAKTMGNIRRGRLGDCHEDQSKGINLDERENKETSHHAQQPEGTDTGGFRACNRNGVLPRLRRGMCFAEPAVSSTGGYVSTEWHQSLLTPWYPPMAPLCGC